MLFIRYIIILLLLKLIFQIQIYVILNTKLLEFRNSNPMIISYIAGLVQNFEIYYKFGRLNKPRKQEGELKFSIATTMHPI